VASTTEFTIDDLGHCYLVTSSLELEAKVSVANLATKTNTVEPVWKYHRTDTGRIGVVVDNNICVLCMC
jgi:hypothetical protein